MLILLFLFFNPVLLEDTLLYVVEYSRHGARYPSLAIFPWNKLRMALTPGGMRQEYLLGLGLRKRYILNKVFLDYYYNPEQITVQATRTDRTIASAYAQLAGLYPHGTGQVLTDPYKQKLAVPPNPFNYTGWSEELGNAAVNYTHPLIPVRTMGSAKDHLLDPQEACPSIEVVVAEHLIEHEEERQKFDQDHRNLYNEIAKTLNKTKDDLSLRYGLKLRNALICGLFEGVLKMNETYGLELINRSAVMYEYAKYENYLLVSYGDYQVSKLMATPFLTGIVKSFERVIEGVEEKLKYEMYVASDTLFHAIMLQLGYNGYTMETPFTSIMLFELYRNSTGSDEPYYVRIMYNNKVNATYPLTEFTKLVKSVTYPEQTFWEYCENFDANVKDTSMTAWIILGGVAIVLVIIAVAVVRTIKYRKWEMARIEETTRNTEIELQHSQQLNVI
eukprot:TRINITY_DN3170_c0_g1_i1.p1 TRINITY_DN3170_c0_g1~~TRINITY_DN3170_c0_g1_i1.p1  ORF type:complete len:485 (+),score=29.43 TRINITY_DN3170_c0_g1_i1:118-1455(+)